MLSCYHPATGRLLGFLLVAFLLTITVLGLRRHRQPGVVTQRNALVRRFGIALAVFAALVALTLWLGSFARSPLNFARQPVLRGFTVEKRGRVPQQLLSGEGFSISYSSLAAINLVVQPAKVSCNWVSREGATLDVPDSCDIVYEPPVADFDVLRVRVGSACGLPDSVGYLNVQILP